MKRIRKLSADQRARLAEWRERWIAIGLSTEPADKPRAEAAYRDCYRYAGLNPDVPVIWVQSPIVGALAASIAARFIIKSSEVESAVWSEVESAVRSPVGLAVRSAVGLAVRSAVGSAVRSEVELAVRSPVESAVGSAVWLAVRLAVWSAVRSAVESEVESAVRSEVGSEVWSAVWSEVWSAVWSAVRSAVESAVWSEVESAVRSPVGLAVRSAVWSAVRSPVESAVWSEVESAVRSEVESAVGSEVESAVRYHWLGGAHWSSWPACESFYREVCGLALPGDLSSRGSAYAECSVAAGYWWPNRKFILACDRPAFIKIEDGRLHSSSGHAIEWRDGWGISVWRGVAVSDAWLAGSPPTASEALSQENTERRRAACEIVGWHRILLELRAETIDADDDPMIGTLVEVSLPGSGRERFLRVLCGTGREFAIPVPPTVQTALEGNAWTYGIDGNLLQTKEHRT